MFHRHNKNNLQRKGRGQVKSCSSAIRSKAEQALKQIPSHHVRRYKNSNLKKIMKNYLKEASNNISDKDFVNACKEFVKKAEKDDDPAIPVIKKFILEAEGLIQENTQLLVKNASDHNDQTSMGKDKLPKEILNSIFSYLEPGQLINAGNSCSLFSRTAKLINQSLDTIDYSAILSSEQIFATESSTHIALSHHGRLLAIAYYKDKDRKNYLTIYDTNTNEVCAHTDINRYQLSLAFSKDDKYLLTSDSSSNRMTIFDYSSANKMNLNIFDLSGPTITLTKLSTISLSDRYDHLSDIMVALPDGKIALANSSSLQIYDIESKKRIINLTFGDHEIRSMILSSDEKSLICCTYHSVGIHKLENNNIQWFSIPSGCLNRASLSPNNNFILFADADSNAIQSFNLTTKTCTTVFTSEQRYQEDVEIENFSFLKNNIYLLVATASENKNGEIAIWDRRTNTCVKTIPCLEKIKFCINSENNKLIIHDEAFIGESRVRIYDFPNKKCLEKRPEHKDTPSVKSKL